MLVRFCQVVVLLLFKPLDFANLMMGQLVTLEKKTKTTTIDPELLIETGAFDSVRDFSKFYASGFTKTNFGSPAHPSVRGLPADIFVDGMRQGLRNFGNGMPFSACPFLPEAG